MFDEELAAIRSEDFSATVDFKSLGLMPDEVYKLQVVSEDGVNQNRMWLHLEYLKKKRLQHWKLT